MKTSRFALRTAQEKNCFHFQTTAYSAFPMGTAIRIFSLCRFLDQTHAEIDGVKYAVQEFAQRMEHNKINFAPA